MGRICADGAVNEGDLLGMAQIGQPVPVKGRFAAQHDVGAKRFDLGEEFFTLAGFEIPLEVFFAVLVDDTGVHLVGVQVDSAVKLVLLRIEIHLVSPWVGLSFSQLIGEPPGYVFRSAAQQQKTNFTA